MFHKANNNRLVTYSSGGNTTRKLSSSVEVINDLDKYIISRLAIYTLANIDNHLTYKNIHALLKSTIASLLAS